MKPMTQEKLQANLISILQQVANQEKQRIFYDVLSLYPKYKHLTCSIYSTQSMGQYIALIQVVLEYQLILKLEGDVDVPYGNLNQFYPVPVIIQFRQSYPAIAPVFKIKNPNPQSVKVNDQYLQGDQMDSTYIVTCQAVQGWNPKTSKLVSVIEQIMTRFQQVFPFFSTTNVQKIQPDPKSNGVKKFEEPKQQQPVQNQGIRKEYMELIGYFVVDLIKDIKDQKKNLDMICVTKQQLDSDESQLCYANLIIGEKQDHIMNVLAEFNSFQVDNEGKEVNHQNVEQYIVTIDPLQNQIVELVSSNLGIADTYKYLQQKFKQGEVNLENCLLCYRRLAEVEFDNRLLIKKGLSGNSLQKKK